MSAAGANGVGKTTTMGKLANRLRQEGHTVLLCAADTFRAAAIEQLEVWAKRANVEIVKQKSGIGSCCGCLMTLSPRRLLAELTR